MNHLKRDLWGRFSSMQERITTSPWPGHEHVRGWGIFGLSMSTGHVLAVRVFPEGDFAPYKSVWHRDPEGYLVTSAHAFLDGENLGWPVRMRPNPQIGGVSLPARGVLAIGQEHWRIKKLGEYEALRADVGASLRAA